MQSNVIYLQVPKRTNQSASNPGHALHESPLSNGSPQNIETNDADLSPIFGTSSQFLKTSAIKLTNTSAKLHSRKLGDEPVCSNILEKSQDKRRSLKTDWLDKCKPELQKKNAMFGNNLPGGEVENDAYGDDLKRSLSEKQDRMCVKLHDEQKAESHKTEIESLRKEMNDSLSSKTGGSELNSSKPSVCQQNDCESIQPPLENQKILQPVDCTQTKTRTRNTNNHCENKAKRQSKRKRTEEDTSSSSKRSKQSEEPVRNDNSRTVQQLSSFEAFEFPEEEAVVAGQSDEILGLGEEDGGSGDEVERKGKKKMKQSMSLAG